jgi:hypothetical protein
MWAAAATMLAATTVVQASPAPRTAGVSRVSAQSSGSQVKLSGWATFSGAVIGSANDAAKDAQLAQGGPSGSESAAAQAGGELLGADLIYRPELGDLFVRIRVSSIPTAGPAVGLLNVLYGMHTVVSGVPVEIRMQSTGLSSQFGLFDCSSENGCTQVTGATVTGGYGTTGEEIVAAVPLSAFSAITSVKKAHLKEGDKIATPQAFVANAPFNVGAVSDAQTMDDVVLAKGATVTIPTKSVRVTIGNVTKYVGLKNGYFTVSFPASAFGGKRTATAITRTCLGSACVVQKFTVSR